MAKRHGKQNTRLGLCSPWLNAITMHLYVYIMIYACPKIWRLVNTSNGERGLKMWFMALVLFCRFELALQQNEILDVFYDDYFSLADDETTFGAKSDNYLKVCAYI